jgi:hypothetical protein
MSISDSLPQSVVSSILDKWGSDPELAAAGLELGLDEPGPNSPAPEPEVETEQPDPTPVSEEATGEEEEALPVPPGGPIYDREPDPSVTLPDGRVIPASVVAGWLDSPPPRPPVQPEIIPAHAQAQSPPLPPLPQLSEEDLESPAVRALLLIANHHQQQLKALETNQQETRVQIEARVQRENTELANSAASSFQRGYNLPDDIMNEVRRNTQANDMQYYLESVQPDPFKAVEFALTRAYWNTPQARTFEFERQSEARTKAQARKQKLAGVSGGSGSGPRAQEPQYEDWKQAAVAEVAQAMGLSEG